MEEELNCEQCYVPLKEECSVNAHVKLVHGGIS